MRVCVCVCMFVCVCVWVCEGVCLSECVREWVHGEEIDMGLITINVILIAISSQ